MKNFGMSQIIFLLLLVGIVTGCSGAPRPPCDEPIQNKQFYENAIRGHPVVLQLNNTLEFIRADVADCFVKNETSIGLLYRIPSHQSSFGVAYSNYLGLAYTKSGQINIAVQYTGERRPFTYENVIGLFKEQTAFAEENPMPGVKEFVEKTAPAQGTLIGCCWLGTGPRQEWAEIRYDPVRRLVFEYALPGSIEWIEFPEIKRVHQIIAKNLLVGDLAHCRIGRLERPWGTHMRLDTTLMTQYFTVGLECADGWKDAFVKLTADGSVEQLGIRYEYKNK
jgi:hypothetical protein